MVLIFRSFNHLCGCLLNLVQVLRVLRAAVEHLVAQHSQGNPFTMWNATGWPLIPLFYSKGGFQGIFLDGVAFDTQYDVVMRGLSPSRWGQADAAPGGFAGLPEVQGCGVARLGIGAQVAMSSDLPTVPKPVPTHHAQGCGHLNNFLLYFA